MAINVSLAQLSTLNNQSILSQNNANDAIIQAALPDALSRSGQSPNQMLSNLDMNNNQIINLPPPSTVNSPARLVDVTSPAGPGNIVSGNNVFTGTNSFNNPIIGTESFTQTGTGAIASTANAKLKQIFDARDFGVVADGVTDDQAAMNAATLAVSTAGGGLLRLPSGTILVGASVIVYSLVHIVGTGRESTVIKLKNAANTDVFLGQNANSLFGGTSINGIFDWSIEDLTIDGNMANNTNGSGIAVYGYRWRVKNINLRNCPVYFIHSEGGNFGTANGVDMESTIIDVLGNTCGNHGFYFQGPHDSHFVNVLSVDAGQTTNNAFYGMYFGQFMNARVLGYHGWHTGVTNRTFSQFFCDGTGSDISSSNFEGSFSSPVTLSPLASFNNFASSNKFFASNNGAPQITVRGPENIIKGSIFASAGRPATVGIALGQGSDNASYNEIEVVSQNNFLGAIDFTHSSGNNRVKIIGFHNAGPGYIGTPAATDECWINITGGATSPTQLFKSVVPLEFDGQNSTGAQTPPAFGASKPGSGAGAWTWIKVVLNGGATPFYIPACTDH